MRIKMFLIALLAAVLPMVAQANSNVIGVVVNGSTGAPISGAQVVLSGTDAKSSTDFSGQFSLTTRPGTYQLIVSCDGYMSYSGEYAIAGKAVNVGTIRLSADNYSEDFYGDAEAMEYDEALLEDEEGNAQGIAALTGAEDNAY